MMMRWPWTGLRSVIIALLVVTMTGVSTGCTPTPASNSDSYSAPSTPTCTQLQSAAISYARSGTGDVNATLQALSERCSNEYEIAVDYIANASNSEFRTDSCDELLGFGIRAEAIELLEQDGWCHDGTSVADAPSWPEGGLAWDRARDYAGSVQRVCGPLKSARETEHGTFLNVGHDYPSGDRFTFIFWDLYLEPIKQGVTLCGRGEVYLYDGVAQMEMWDPAALEIWE